MSTDSRMQFSAYFRFNVNQVVMFRFAKLGSNGIYDDFIIGKIVCRYLENTPLCSLANNSHRPLYRIYQSQTRQTIMFTRIKLFQTSTKFLYYLIM